MPFPRIDLSLTTRTMAQLPFVKFSSRTDDERLERDQRSFFHSWLSHQVSILNLLNLHVHGLITKKKVPKIPVERSQNQDINNWIFLFGIDFYTLYARYHIYKNKHMIRKMQSTDNALTPVPFLHTVAPDQGMYFSCNWRRFH
jgi:hypothetical protein